MTDPCAELRELGPELIRDRPGDLPDALRAHLEECAACGALAAGAAALRADLDRWEPEPPPPALVADTLAALAVGPTRRGRRRTSVEILLSSPLSGPPPEEAPPRRRLLIRLFVQAAAAAILAAVTMGFTVVYYPAVVVALEDRRTHKCQERLRRLQHAALTYRKEHPDAKPLHGVDLRRALIAGGYADVLDFVCPSRKGADLQERSFFGELPAGSAPLSPGPLFWDRFGNHSSGVNVVYGDGRVELVTVETFAAWYSRALEGDGDGD